jgi:hypothetical protein
MKTKTRYTLGLVVLMLAMAACTELTEPGELSREPIAPGPTERPYHFARA